MSSRFEGITDIRVGLSLNYKKMKELVQNFEDPNVKKNNKKQEYRVYLSSGLIVEY